MKNIKKIHFVGIKGVGMAPLAIIAKEAGIEVTGSDISMEFITDEVLRKAGIHPEVGFSIDHITDQDLIITTGAHEGFNNVEVVEAKNKNIKVITQGEAVGVFMDGDIFDRKQKGISVTGTHGKTTTTAMIATIFKELGHDPSFVIGTGNVLSLGSSGHFGKGEYFIAEADEYMTEPNYDKTIKFMWQHPKIAIFTNIDFDHPDVYENIDDVRSAFLNFSNSLSDDAVLIACGDNEQVKKLLKEYKGKRITYGKELDNDFVIKNINQIEGKIEFEISNKEKDLGIFKLNIFGEHNVFNAAASIIASLEANMFVEEIKKALQAFRGTKRRAEYIGELESGARVYDDYAHHPAEIQNTLKGFRKTFPDKKIVCVFQPHMYSRTKSLFEQFSDSFNDADTVILTGIYPSLREKPDPSVSMEDLAKKIKAKGTDALFLLTLPSVVEYIGEKAFGEDFVLITMGAGDVYQITNELKIKNYGKNNN